MAYTVGQLSKLARVSVRTLHHYDEIGLLEPSGRSRAGYRLYTDRDLERLQQVLFFRELGFALEDIGRILSDPGFDRREALCAQRSLLVDKLERLKSVLALVDRTLGSLETGANMTDEEMFEVFGDFDPHEHEEEAQRRWGDTDAYKESHERTRRYTKHDWQKIRDEAESVYDALASAMAAGKAADSDEVMDLAERHRRHIDRWFYACSHTMHAGLGEMYVSDPRFRDNFERRAEGLADFFRDAIAANAARATP